ncbi:hypothetical protein [Rhodoligotrophos defluvii]|uniref:hypothetical protein n=1 Tax=Rhodoligotrophos defluvii TaxID=2561934 RepID=UPI0010C9CD4B|nr:hypothetical protein [Rhodoligotrophos defluvii]
MIPRLILVVTVLTAASNPGHAESVRSMVKKACGADYMRVCAAVPPTGDGMKALQCLIDHRKVVSKKCQDALLAAKVSQETQAAPQPAATPRNNWAAQ